jgi:hypothetical protein
MRSRTLGNILLDLAGRVDLKDSSKILALLRKKSRLLIAMHVIAMYLLQTSRSSSAATLTGQCPSMTSCS